MDEIEDVGSRVMPPCLPSSSTPSPPHLLTSSPPHPLTPLQIVEQKEELEEKVKEEEDEIGAFAARNKEVNRTLLVIKISCQSINMSISHVIE